MKRVLAYNSGVSLNGVVLKRDQHLALTPQSGIRVSVQAPHHAPVLAVAHLLRDPHHDPVQHIERTSLPLYVLHLDPHRHPEGFNGHDVHTAIKAVQP